MLGLEIVLLISLLTFGDLAMEQMRAKSNEAPSTVPNVPVAIVVPLPPPKPEGWTEDQVAVLQAQEQVETLPYLRYTCVDDIFCITSVK